MPPILALLLTVGFVVFLFRRDAREQSNVSGALWLPVVWAFLISSRSVGQWLGALGFHLISGSMEEGNPVDAVIFLAFIIMGLFVLTRRRVSLGEVIRNNRWLAVYFLFCFLAVTWSDFPLVAFKRWTKVMGHLVMALIVLTEADPADALVVLMKRCGFLLIPISITLIKYVPDIGRTFDDWGMASNNGVTRNKNELGCICMLWGLFFFWSFFKARRMEPGVARRHELWLNFGFLLMIGWLIWKSHCATAMVCMMLGGLVIVGLGFRWVRPQYLLAYVVGGLLLVGLEETFLGLSSSVLEFLGRSSTLTGRTLLWQELLQFHTNPVVGAGFESFWLGPRLNALWAAHWWHPTEAHNGYLETYLDLGAVGVALLIGLLFTSFMRARSELLRNFEFGRFQLGLLAAFIAYNWTEAAFKGLSPVLFLFLLITIDYPAYGAVAAESLQSDALEEEAEGPYAGSVV